MRQQLIDAVVRVVGKPLEHLALGAELPALEARQLEGDLLQLRVAPRDVAVLALDELLLEVELAAPAVVG